LQQNEGLSLVLKSFWSSFLICLWKSRDIETGYYLMCYAPVFPHI